MQKVVVVLNFASKIIQMINCDSNSIRKSIENLEKPKPNLPSLSIVILTFQRVQFLTGLLDSLSAAISHTSEIEFETVICINGLDPDTHELLSKYVSDSNLNIRVLQLEDSVSPAEARNRACQSSVNQWLLFLDDDVLVPPHLVKNFISLAQKKPNIDVWGGPNLTPLHSPRLELRLGWFLENFFVVGPICYRYKIRANRSILPFEFGYSLCNLFVRSQLFNELHFKACLKTAEENELIYQAEKRSFQVQSDNALFIWHFRRSDSKKFLRQIRNYGFGRGQLIALRCFSLQIFCVVALLFLTFAFLFLTHPWFFLSALLCLHVVLAFQQFVKFRDYSFEFLFLPTKIWFNYLYGLTMGLTNELLQKSKQSPAQVSKPA